MQDQLLDVCEIQATDQAFAAVRADGAVVAWGEEEYGGGSDVEEASLSLRTQERLDVLIVNDGGYIIRKDIA